MTRAQDDIVVDPAETGRERLVHLLGIRAGKVGAAAPIQEQGVAGHKPAVDEEALASGRMARRVDELDLDIADSDDVAALVLDEGLVGDTGDFADVLGLVGLNMDRHVDAAEQGGDASPLTDTILLDGVRGLVMSEQTPDAPSNLVLGCTHFPVFRTRLQQLLGSQAQVIDSAQTTAGSLAAALQSEGLPSNRGGNIQFLATDGMEGFQRVGATFLAEGISDVELVDL